MDILIERRYRLCLLELIDSLIVLAGGGIDLCQSDQCVPAPGADCESPTVSLFGFLKFTRITIDLGNSKKECGISRK